MSDTLIPTPLTDKLCKDRHWSPYREPASGQFTLLSAMTFHAQKLERELSTARAELASTKQDYAGMCQVVRDREAELERVKEVLELAHDHMQLYLVHYHICHNVYDTVFSALHPAEEQSNDK